MHNTETKNAEVLVEEFKYNQIEVQDIDFPAKVSALKLSDGNQSSNPDKS